MESTLSLLDAAKKAEGIESDYAFAKRHGLKLTTVSSWRTQRSEFNDEAAELIAGILGREPGEIMAICQAQRAKDKAGKTRWLRVAALLAATAGASPGAGAAVGADLTIISPTLYTLCEKRRRRSATLRALFDSLWRFPIIEFA